MMRPQMAKSLLRRRAPCTQNNIIRSFGTASLLKSRIVRNENEMQELGAQFAAVSKAGDVVFLQGELGAGKTCFARGFIRKLVNDSELHVTSPTYLLINTYESATTKNDIFHIDLYRLDKVDETDKVALGLDHVFANGISLVEWAERFNQDSVPAERLEVLITYDNRDPSVRHVEFQPFGDRWNLLV